MRTYGYDDPELVPNQHPRWDAKRWIALTLALLFLVALWLALDWKLLTGDDWISETYDNPDWRTNEGNLHTYGAWDLEAHIWKTELIMEHFPDFHWNPYWYLGMPLLKYYQLGFYGIHWLFIAISGASAAKASLLMIVYAHLIATLLTFLLCYKVSRRIWVSALCSAFLLENTFISLRSYGWEPISIVFLFLYPLGLLLFLKEPLRPFRFWLVLVVGLAYLGHPLLWFTLLMTMGLYIFSILLRTADRDDPAGSLRPLGQYVLVALCSMAIGAVQFLPQLSYQQASSGAHMGVTYLPFYQVPFNIITLWDFLFDAGNLKGPGPIIMIAMFLLATFAVFEYRHRKKPLGRMLRDHEMITALAFALFMMVLFYYMEKYDIFPMNFLRSIQYHRIIPEFIITAGALVAAMSHIAHSFKHKIVYYTMLVAFVLASTIIIYNVQEHWQTTTSISDKPEFITEPFQGRITFPYTDQSLSVRSSFTGIPQVYGYYEQGITNPYADEMFSVSSGFHNADLTILYLKAANVGRLYVNMEEGERDRIVITRLNGTLEFHDTGERYSYFEIPLVDPGFAQAVDGVRADQVETLEMGERELFRDHYVGSFGEEFVSTDKAEIAYLRAYVDLIETPYAPDARMRMVDPDHYLIEVRDAEADTEVIVKMTYDADFTAAVHGEELPIEMFGPGFMRLRPGRTGDYEIMLEYHVSRIIVIGAWVSSLAILSLATLFLVKRWKGKPKKAPRSVFPRGDL